MQRDECGYTKADYIHADMIDKMWEGSVDDLHTALPKHRREELEKLIEIAAEEQAESLIDYLSQRGPEERD